MELTSGGHTERHKVDVTVASGRQHQLYAMQGERGALTLLPVVWSTKAKQWLPLSLYQPADLSPTSKNYWAAQDMTRGCVSCHLSQAYREVGPEGVRNARVDLSINCEACHGAGAEHVRRRRAGRTDEVYRDLSKLGSVEESRVCGGCHGFQLKRYVFPPADDQLPQIFVTSLINGSLRPDGTQHLTSYQYPGHVLSAGFRGKILRCKDCHAPHGLEARNKQGESAVGALSNKQCTGCHEELDSPRPASRHSHHSASVRCVDCHMSYSFIGDDDRRKQRTSDHSISIPHPQETIDLGDPNACNTCHDKKTPQWSLDALTRWGMKDALGARDWVETVALGRKSAPGATQRLVALLTKHDVGTYLQASALDLLDVQPRDPALVPTLAPFARGPEPYLRAAAIRALETHDDPAARPGWLTLGMSDAHPFVRLETFSMVKDVAMLTPEQLDRELADVLAYMSPPTDGLAHLIAVHNRRGEARQALELVDLLERLTLPQEQRHLGLEDVRAGIRAEIDKPD